MYMHTKTIIFKIGGNATKDIKQLFDNPKSALGHGNTHTIYVKKLEDVIEMLTTNKLRQILQIDEDIADCPDEKPNPKKNAKIKADISKLLCKQVEVKLA